MAILEGFIAAWKNYPSDEVKIRVAVPSKIGPSKDLFKQFQEKTLSFEDYETKLIQELSNNKLAIGRLQAIAEVSKAKNIRLICFEKSPPCHRFTLVKIIEALQGKDGDEFEAMRALFGVDVPEKEKEAANRFLAEIEERQTNALLKEKPPEPLAPAT